MVSVGGTRLAPIGLADSAMGDLFSDVEDWAVGELQPALHQHFGCEMEVGKEEHKFSAPASAHDKFLPAIVTESLLLSNPDSGVTHKRHLELRLPEGTLKYRAGEHVLVLARNSEENVQRALRRFGLREDTQVVVPVAMPTPVCASDLFRVHVELGRTASRRDIRTLEDTTVDPSTKLELQRLAGPAYETEIRATGVSILALLERFPTATPTLACFISMMAPNRPRTYSVSSAPKWRPSHVALTYTVIGSGSGPAQQAVRGFASSYMASLKPNDVVQISFQQRAKPVFQPPLAGDRTPVIMVAAGSAIAPFRGLLQERMLHLTAERTPPLVLLFYGCSGPSMDDIYRGEMDSLERRGVVEVIRAYSRDPTAESRYVGDAIRKHHERVSLLWNSGAIVMVCGAKRMADSVYQAVVDALSIHRHLEDGRDRKLVRGENYLEEIFF